MLTKVLLMALKPKLILFIQDLLADKKLGLQ